MTVIAEIDAKKDARNRIVLPSAAEFEHYHMKVYDDGHLELYPRVLTDPTISTHTLAMMDAAMDNVAQGIVGKPVNPSEALRALGEA